MNIFALSRDPAKIAKWQVDKHCVKMILESAQMLSTAHRVLDGKEGKLQGYREAVLYKATHINHPCSVWTRKTSANYLWHVDLLTHMLAEYTYRYEKVHKCQAMMVTLSLLPKNIEVGVLTTPAIAMPDDCLVYRGRRLQVTRSYRQYYLRHKAHIATWKKRKPPHWWTNELKEESSVGHRW